MSLSADLDVGEQKAMAPHSSTLAWKIPWTEEPGRLQSMGSLESDTTEVTQPSLAQPKDKYKDLNKKIVNDGKREKKYK